MHIPCPIFVSPPSATEQPTAAPTSTILNNALMVTLPQYTAENVRPIMDTTIVNLMAALHWSTSVGKIPN